MTTVLEECTTEDQRSVVPLLWAKGLNAKDIHIEMFSCLRWKVFIALMGSHLGRRMSLKDVRKSQMMPDQVALLRLRQKELCSGWKS
jgi:hypothetical protein